MTVQLPDGATLYKRTATFTEASVPAGLLKDHATKAGTWGLIRVEAGQLRYVVTDPRRPLSETILDPASCAAIEPTILHHVEPLGAVLFHVEFYRLDSSSEAPVINKP